MHEVKPPTGSTLTISEEIFASFNQTAKKHHGRDFTELVSQSPDNARRLLAHFVVESAKRAITVVDGGDRVVASWSDDGSEATTNYAQRLSPERDIYAQRENIVVNVMRKPGLIDRIMGREQQLVRSIQLSPSNIAN